MRISGTEPSSVILSQNMKFKNMKSDDPKVPLRLSSSRLSATWINTLMINPLETRNG